MTSWKVLITDGLSDKGIAILSAAAQVDNKPDISGDDLLKVAGEYDALVVRGRTKVTPAVFEAGTAAWSAEKAENRVAKASAAPLAVSVRPVAAGDATNCSKSSVSDESIE